MLVNRRPVDYWAFGTLAELTLPAPPVLTGRMM